MIFRKKGANFNSIWMTFCYVVKHLKELLLRSESLFDSIKLPYPFSPPYLQVKFKTRLKACLFGLDFLSDLAKGRGTMPPNLPFHLFWLRYG